MIESFAWDRKSASVLAFCMFMSRFCTTYLRSASDSLIRSAMFLVYGKEIVCHSIGGYTPRALGYLFLQCWDVHRENYSILHMFYPRDFRYSGKYIYTSRVFVSLRAKTRSVRRPFCP